MRCSIFYTLICLSLALKDICGSFFFYQTACYIGNVLITKLDIIFHMVYENFVYFYEYINRKTKENNLHQEKFIKKSWYFYYGYVVYLKCNSAICISSVNVLYMAFVFFLLQFLLLRLRNMIYYRRKSIDEGISAIILLYYF